MPRMDGTGPAGPEDLPPHKTILEALDVVVAVLVGVVDRGAEFLLQVFLVIIQATINLNTGKRSQGTASALLPGT